MTMTGNINIARLHHPVTVLGPGRRLGVWVQGCSIGCSGCMSKDTWKPDAGNEVDVETLAEYALTAIDHEGLDGITISGGEPFEQHVALASWLQLVRARKPHINVMAYSGYSLNRLEAQHSELLGLLDVVVTGPYVANRAGSTPWIGSDNQELVVLNPSVRALFEDAQLAAQAGDLQIGVDEGGLYVLGTPVPGTLERLRTRLDVMGVRLEEVSWI